MKTVLTQERERERVERERIRQEREEHMDVDGQPQEQTADEDLPTCMDALIHAYCAEFLTSSVDSSIEAPPSLLPPGRYCDITGLEVRCLAASLEIQLDLSRLFAYMSHNLTSNLRALILILPPAFDFMTRVSTS